MNELCYTEILETHMNRLLIRYALLAFLFIFFMIYPLLFKKDKNERKIYEGWPLCLFCLVLLIMMFCWQMIPIIKDIRHESFHSVESVYYERSNTRSSRSIFSTGKVLIKIDGDYVALALPAGNNSKYKFPIGEYNGDVIYSERSEIIVYFKPDNEITD